MSLLACSVESAKRVMLLLMTVSKGCKDFKTVHLRLEGPPIEKFNFHLALSKWRTKKQRRF